MSTPDPDAGPQRLLVPDIPSTAELQPWLERISENGWFTNFGPLCRAFEARLAQALQAPRPVALTTVSSATAGLELALAALDLPRGSGVLLPSLTFPATATAVLRNGLEPVLCDVEEGSWALSPAIARAQLGDGHPIAAVLPVAVFGRPVDPSGWDDFTRETGIPVIIDAAGAFGDQALGETTPAVFSLHATKALAVGEGGLVASTDEEFIARVRDASNFGFMSGGDLIGSAGTNAKLSEFHAAVGLAALKNWPRHAWRRRLLAARYAKALRDALGDGVVFHQGGRQHWVRSVFVVRLPGVGVDAALLGELEERGVAARRWYHPPIHHQPAFANCPHAGALKVTESLGAELLGLPFHLELTAADLRHVAAALRELVGG